MAALVQSQPMKRGGDYAGLGLFPKVVESIRGRQQKQLINDCRCLAWETFSCTVDAMRQSPQRCTNQASTPVDCVLSIPLMILSHN